MSAKNTVEFDGDSFSVDAAVIASGLGVTEARLQRMMSEGRVTSRCERGVDEDSGRYRLTFFSARRRLSLTVDADGQIIDREVTRRLISRTSPVVRSCD